MRLHALLLSSVLIAAIALPAGAAVQVTFTAPERYSDVRIGPGPASKQREMVLKDLRAWLEQLGMDRLAAGDTLRIEILDINLAGRDQPWNAANPQARLLDEVNWPSIKLRYVLEHDGQVVSQAEETVADQDYLSHSTVGSSSDPLRYEKKMLSDWFDERFGKQAGG